VNQSPSGSALIVIVNRAMHTDQPDGFTIDRLTNDHQTASDRRTRQSTTWPPGHDLRPFAPPRPAGSASCVVTVNWFKWPYLARRALTYGERASERAGGNARRVVVLGEYRQGTLTGGQRRPAARRTAPRRARPVASRHTGPLLLSVASVHVIGLTALNNVDAVDRAAVNDAPIIASRTLPVWPYLGPIPSGHSGSLCHALSSSSLASWTSMRRRRATVPVATPGEWA